MYPPKVKTPLTPVKAGAPIHPTLAVFIRIALGGIGLALYSFIAFFVMFLVMANLLVSRADAYVWGGSTSRTEAGTRIWQNRIMWMWFDGFWATAKYIFTGGTGTIADIFMEFIHAVKHPLIKVAGDYWDQETKRL